MWEHRELARPRTEAQSTLQQNQESSKYQNSQFPPLKTSQTCLNLQMKTKSCIIYNIFYTQDSRTILYAYELQLNTITLSQVSVRKNYTDFEVPDTARTNGTSTVSNGTDNDESFYPHS